MKIHLPAPLKIVRAALLSVIFIGPQLINNAYSKSSFAGGSGKTTPAFASYQQSITVSGKITSASDNEGLPGVNVIVKGTSNGTVTDVNGEFRIDVPSRDAILIISSIGFDSQEITVGDQTIINIALAESSTSLNEVVVVGYGTQQKMSVTNSIADIKGEEMVQRPVGNILQSVQGKMPGVTILDRGGQPGSNNMQIVIRGVTKPYNPVGLDQTQTSTIGNNLPLFIIDGIEQPYQYINPADIESFTVLKDASSSAIYGSRGGNGVVLITTKRAKEGKVNVSYSGSYSMQSSLTQPKAMDIESYLRLQNVAYANVSAAGAPPHYTDDYINTYVAGTKTNPLKYPLPYDWYNIMLKDAPQFNNSIAVSGGNETMKARLSVRNQDQKGIISNTDSKLTDIRFNADLKVAKNITIGGDLNYRYQANTEPHDITNLFRLFMQNAIWAVPQYPNGDYGGGTQGNSPLLLAQKGGLNKTQNDYFYGQLKGTWDIVKGLKLTSQVAVRNQFLTGKDYTNTWQTVDSTTVKKSNVNNSLTESRTVDREVTWNNLLYYELNTQNHAFKAMGGYAQIYHFNTTISAYRQNFYNNDVQSLGQGINDATKNNGGSDYTWGLRSYFGRLNYAFKDKYLFEANLRYDGSSRFAQGNRYAQFPSASVGYRISEEAFWGGIRDVVSDLKIRASRGVSGNNGVDLYSYVPTLQSVAYSFNGTVAQGYLQRTANDPNLTWERTAQSDIGLDADLFNGRLSFTVDYYNKRTTGDLLAIPIPGVVGLQPGPQNAMTVENKGWEFLVSTRNRIGDFTLNANVNLAINNNKIVDLSGTSDVIIGNDIDPRYIQGKGYSINAFWGYKTAGLYQTDAQAAADPTFMRAAKAGDVRMVDRNSDGKIDPSDMTYLGNSLPKYTFGGNINAGWKQFQLNIFLQGTAGSKMRIARALGEAGNYEGFTPDIYTNNYWTPEHTDARFARPTKNDLRNQASTDRMLANGSYLRVKNVQLVYNIPTTLLERVRIQNASISLSATNLLTFSELFREWHLDPESSSGWQNYYPQTRMYTLGLNIQL